MTLVTSSQCQGLPTTPATNSPGCSPQSEEAIKQDLLFSESRGVEGHTGVITLERSVHWEQDVTDASRRTVIP